MRRVGIANVGIIPRPLKGREGIGRRWNPSRSAVVGYLRKGADMLRDGTAIKEAGRRSRENVVTGVGSTGRRRRCLGMRVTQDSHHRDGRHPYFTLPSAIATHVG